MEINTILITQARSGSTRLPGKVLLSIQGKSLLEIHLHRLLKSRMINKFILATTMNPEDDAVAAVGDKVGVEVFRGSEKNVLDRFYQSVQNYQPKWVVRVTADCPLIDPELIDQVVSYADHMKVDYCSNTLVEQYPDGQDIEVFTFQSLEKAWKEAGLESEKEHVTPYIRKNSTFFGRNLFKSANYPCGEDYSKIRITVDEYPDLKLIEELIKHLGFNEPWKTYADYIISNDLQFINYGINRNEGYIKSLNNDNI